MIPTDEFYDKPAVERQELVDAGHVVTDGKIAETVPSNRRGGIHVFEEPVTDLVVDRLKGARYTANELAPDFPVDKEELDDLFNWMKYEPMDLLTDHFGVLRVVDTEGAEYVYTVEAIPFSARCIDPTLSGYLLDANDRCPVSRPRISTKHNSTSRNEYVDQAIDYWGIPEKELTVDLDDQVGFAKSTLGPLPVISDLPDAERVIERFQSTEDSYRRKQHTVQSVKKNISFHKSRCRRNPSLGAFQSFSLFLMDVSEHASIENDSQLRELVTQGGQILYRCLYGNLWPGGSTAWRPFEITLQDKSVDTFDRRIIDIVEQQPTSNGQLSERWDFSDGREVWEYLQSDLSQYVTRNTDKFACATESARRYISGLEQDDKITLSKDPPRVPGKGRITLAVSEDRPNDDSGIDWSR